MPSLKDVQNKIGAVKKTKQITKAMNMVASAKLRNAQSRIERFKPYAEKFYEMLGGLAGGADETIHPLLQSRDEVETIGIVLVTSDRGLCGSFNMNINQKALRFAQSKVDEGKKVVFYCVGKKARDRIRKNAYEILAEYPDAMSNFDFQLANELGLMVIDDFTSGKVDEVHLVFGEFVSIARQIPDMLQVLPMKQAAEEQAEDTGAGEISEYIYEPSVEGLLAELLPRFVKVQIYRGLLETSASEHAARMAAMDNATKNCDELVSQLTLQYNKARQATITKELMDIVGGAEALKG
jgi:F-type H+-transporting ATPase subunit gamma